MLSWRVDHLIETSNSSGFPQHRAINAKRCPHHPSVPVREQEMGENGSWTHNYHNLSSFLGRTRGRPLQRGWWDAFMCSPGLNLWVMMAVAGTLLCQLPPTLAIPILCPGQCSCFNVTSLNDEKHAIVIDCSNGSLPGFFYILSPKSQTTSANFSTTDSALNFLPNLNNLSYVERNETQNVWHGDVDTGPVKFSGTETSNPLPLVPGVSLDLSFNNVTTLTMDLREWKAAPLVKEINLSNNLIQSATNVSLSSLQFLVNLVSLDLSNNRISVLSPLDLRHFTALQYVSLANNRIHTIANPGHDIITPPPSSLHSNLFYIDLSNNDVAGLPARAFSAFRMLARLNLSSNNISRIDRLAFEGVPRLQVLSLSHNPISSLDYPVFQNTYLTDLSLAYLPYLTSLHYTALHALTHLKNLNLSHTPRLSFLQPGILSSLDSLTSLDLSGSGIHQLSPITFQNKPQLKSVYLHNLSLECQCTNAWLVDEIYKNNSIYRNVSSIRCTGMEYNETFSLADAVFPCEEVLIHNMTRALSVNLGSTLMLQCRQVSSPHGDILSWTTPRGRVFYFHHFHPNASQHLFSPRDVQPDAVFHRDHVWHQSSSYYSELSSDDKRILILSDGSLFIDYMMRDDAGPYTCMVRNAQFNNSGTVVVHLVYKISGDVKIIACIVGILCAVGVFTLNVVYIVIMWLARRLINKRRREHIGQMLENLNSYKSTQITRIYENYTCQLNRVRNQYHIQCDRLHRNYTMQVERVKRGCSHQVEKVRDNYNSKLTQLREYSSNQIVQIRDRATTQIGRIRDYGSSHLDRLRETYKLQHQHMMKLLDTLNLDNCRSIVETECMRTESMMYDLDLLSQEDERTESPISTAESEYNTATSSPVISLGSRQPPNVALHLEEENNQVGTQEVSVLTESGRNSVTTKPNSNSGGGEGRVYMGPANDDDDCDDHDIEIEMNTTLDLPGNVQLEAKEVWMHNVDNGGENHTLYTKLHNPQGREHADLQSNPPHSLGHSKPSYTEINEQEDYHNLAKTKTAVSLPSIDIHLGQTAKSEPEWGSLYAQQEASPVKVCLKPIYFPFEDEEDDLAVNLYDADVDEGGDDDEKNENDTMV